MFSVVMYNKSQEINMQCVNNKSSSQVVIDSKVQNISSYPLKQINTEFHDTRSTYVRNIYKYIYMIYTNTSETV